MPHTAVNSQVETRVSQRSLTNSRAQQCSRIRASLSALSPPAVSYTLHQLYPSPFSSVLAMSLTVANSTSNNTDSTALEPLFVLRADGSPVHAVSFHPVIVSKQLYKEWSGLQKSSTVRAQQSAQQRDESSSDSDSDSESDSTTTALTGHAHTSLQRGTFGGPVAQQRGYPPFLLSG